LARPEQHWSTILTDSWQVKLQNGCLHQTKLYMRLLTHSPSMMNTIFPASSDAIPVSLQPSTVNDTVSIRL